MDRGPWVLAVAAMLAWSVCFTESGRSQEVSPELVFVAPTQRLVPDGPSHAHYELVWTALHPGDDGTWIGCDVLGSAPDAGAYRASVTTLADGRCALSGIERRSEPQPVALFAGWPSRLGDHAAETTADQLAVALGVPPATLPRGAHARELLRAGPYLLAFHGWLGLVAAFVDQLPGLAVRDAQTLAPSASYDEVRAAISRRTRQRTLLGEHELRDELGSALAREMAASRVALGDHVGVLDVRGRPLVFVYASGGVPQALAYVRSVVIRHHLDGTLTR